MNGSTLHRTATACAEELPGARLEHPFGPGWEVFKVRGKVFLLMTEVPGQPVVILKADPGEARALRQENSYITPGYHMNKKHWITLEGGEGVDSRLVRELVTESYRLVVAGLPRAEQPVDPHTFGLGTGAAR
ncbi:MmcQ/YjbR family DNA-binding protein [Streptomyces sp. NPDC127098]|uniref:MmcQ/YjbR family DNA-binding protein n=1 Tax=Streptomyces sp. NPDC127098 TaxID=3347137 RepID=UPI0036497072